MTLKPIDATLMTWSNVDVSSTIILPCRFIFKLKGQVAYIFKSNMHVTANYAGKAFVDVYGKKGGTVIDLGGKDVNGTLRHHYERKGVKYICVDMEEHESVDVVVRPGDPLPFETASIDMVISNVVLRA